MSDIDGLKSFRDVDSVEEFYAWRVRDGEGEEDHRGVD